MDNQPPSAVDDLKNRLTDATEVVHASLKAVFVALNKMPEVITVDIESQAVDQLGQAKMALDKLEDIRKKHKKPLDAQVTALQAHFHLIAGLISDEKTPITIRNPAGKGIIENPAAGIYQRVLARLGIYQKGKADAEKAEREAIQKRAEAEAKQKREEAETAAKEALALSRDAQSTADREAAAGVAVRAQELSAEADQAAKNATAAAKARPVGHAVGTGAKSHLRTSTKFELIDKSKVPLAYLMLDDSKVNKAIDAGMTDIPGIRFYEESAATLVVK